MLNWQDKIEIVMETKCISGKVRIVKYLEPFDANSIFGVEYNSSNPFDDTKGEWEVMGGSVGYTDSTFKTLKEAKAFLEKGLRSEKKNPDIWLEMLAV